jgi:hypothetical protein
LLYSRGRGLAESSNEINDEDLSLTKEEAIARSREEQRKLNRFWLGIKRVVDSQAIRKPHERYHDLNLEIAKQVGFVCLFFLYFFELSRFLYSLSLEQAHTPSYGNPS